MTPWTDDQLVEYLAGNLTDASARVLEADVAMDAELEQRLIALDKLGPCVKDAFLAMPGVKDRVSFDVPGLVEPVKTPRRFASLYAAVAGLAIGVIGVGLLSKPDDQLGTWQDQVAAYQVLYVPETIATLNTSAEELDVQFERAGEAIGLNLQRSALAEFEALTLRRAQILGLNGEALIQIVFSTKANVPIAFCIFKGGEAATEAQVSQTMLGLESVTWSTGAGHEFLLIGGHDSELIRGLAGQLQSIFAPKST